MTDWVEVRRRHRIITVEERDEETDRKRSRTVQIVKAQGRCEEGKEGEERGAPRWCEGEQGKTQEDALEKKEKKRK